MGQTASRRAFVVGSLIAGYTMATERAYGQEISTDTTGLEAGVVEIPVKDGKIPAYFARPAGAGPFPIVLVNEEVFGIHRYIADICRRLAKQGYLAIAPEVFARFPDYQQMTTSMDVVRANMAKLPDEQVIGDVDAALAWAVANKGDGNRVAVTGFCRGGRTTWLYAAHNPKVKAAVAWYGNVLGNPSALQPKTATDLAGELKAPLLGLYGSADQGIPVASVEAAAAKAKAAGRKVEIVVYPDAPHGFHADYRPTYRKDAAEDAWKRMLAFFKAHGV